MAEIELRPLALSPPLNVTLIKSNDELPILAEFFATCGKEIGFDIETSLVKDFFYRRIRTMQFGTKDRQIVVDLLGLCGGDPDVLYNAQGYYGVKIPECLKPLIDVIRPVLCTLNYLKVGVNLSFEYENFYWLLGLRTFGYYCCSVVEKVIWAGLHSLKDYGFYSMEEMMARYFHIQIDKTLQTSFTLDGELSLEQIDYAALDTRTPLGIKGIQQLILEGRTPEWFGQNKMSATADRLALLPRILFGDNLEKVAEIENNAIGAFKDMHVHGDRVDTTRWLERVARKKVEFADTIRELDKILIPLVGTKLDIITDEEVAELELKWKSFNVLYSEEVKLRADLRAAKKVGDELVIGEIAGRMSKLGTERKAVKEHHKAICSDLKKKRTKIRNLAAKCKGDALINYDSGKQLLAVLTTMKGLKTVEDTSDETLEKYEHIPIMALLREMRGLAKEIGTYGESWAKQWTTKPCKEEGWIHPGDERLHCEFNQQDAETGRSTSSKPNGQNLPQDKDYRECFIADPDDEGIRVSNCCNADSEYRTVYEAYGSYSAIHCTTCNKEIGYDGTHAEEYVLITSDMSGAELRIIAELAKDPIWIGAFSRGEDVHSVGTEILYPDEWPKGTVEGCKYFALNEAGEPKREKCKCPEHNELRNDNKATNFLLAYGGGPTTLAKRIKKPVGVASELMDRHKFRFPNIWDYLDRAGQEAKRLKKAFDMFGRRRIFSDPTWEDATQRAKEDKEEKLQFPEEVQEANISKFEGEFGRKPSGGLTEIDSEMYNLTHRLPTSKEIGSAYKGMFGSIERQGKNHGIQGTNASIAKLAAGSGFDPEGKPYLWHVLPKYGAKLIKFVHDELVIQSPKRHAHKVAEEVQSAFRRAAAEVMTKVVMESEFGIAKYWKK